MPDQFPDDGTGGALRRMWEGGDKLTQPRDIDFSVAFPSRAAAEGFAAQFREEGYKTDVSESNCVPELPWDVHVTKNMLPNYAGICAFEDELETVASPLGGRNDGWGCFRITDAN